MVDGYWADDARIDETRRSPAEADEIAGARAGSGWTGLYFGGTAFKKQRPVDPAHYEQAAKIAATRTRNAKSTRPSAMRWVLGAGLDIVVRGQSNVQITGA